jgi:hypothetical protein
MKNNGLKIGLLKKWRREAKYRIGVFKEEDDTYAVVFDKSGWGDVSYWSRDLRWDGSQIIKDGIETIEEAKEVCDGARRAFIRREARREWNEKHYGSKNRYY